MACSRSNASGPRTSPTMMRSGRMRRQLRTRSRMVIWPSPSRLGGRVSRRTVCGCCSCSSAASSQVMMRSSLSMNWVRQLSSVVLPEPVPPETSVLTRQRPMTLQDLGALRRDRAEADELVERQLVLLELADGERRAVDGERRHDDVDAGAVGQARVADRRGFVDAPADLADDALADVQELLVVAEADAGLLDLALDFDVGGAGAVHHDVGDVVAREQRLERPVAEHVVADVVEQFLLLGDRHHDVLDRDDLVDDVADFLARRIGVELGELRRDRSPRSGRRRSCSWSRSSARYGANRPPSARRRRLVRHGVALAGRRRADDRRAEADRWHRRAAAFDDAGRRRAPSAAPPAAPDRRGCSDGCAERRRGAGAARALAALLSAVLRFPNTC